jgi:hypothetical protein
MDETRITPDQPAFPPWQAPEPQKRRSRWGIWGTITAVVVVLGCLGGAGYLGMHAMRSTTPPVTKGLSFPGASAAPGATPDTEAESVTGPRASTYPVRTADDLKRVCEQWYYPKSPKVKSAGTQPVSIFAQDSKDFDTKHEATLFDIPNWYTAPKQKAWDPSSPGKVRLVACVDLVQTGKKIKSCKYDDPKGLKIPLREAKYRLALYEVATGKKVIEKTLPGEDEECPFMVLLGADRNVYSQVADRQYYETLKKYVEK